MEKGNLMIQILLFFESKLKCFKQSDIKYILYYNKGVLKNMVGNLCGFIIP